MWTWRHPDVERIAVRARWVGTGILLAWLLAMVAIAIAQRDEDLVGIVLSAVTAPTIFGLFLLAAWYFGLHRTTRFVLHVDQAGTLHRTGGGRAWSIPLPGAETVEATAFSSTVHHGAGTPVRSSGVQLTVVNQGRRVRAVLPGTSLGTRNLTEPERLHLENTLRWYAGLPPSGPA